MIIKIAENDWDDFEDLEIVEIDGEVEIYREGDDLVIRQKSPILLN